MPRSTDSSFLPPGRMALSLAFAGLPRALGARTLVAQASALGFRAVHLDASHPELRPRDLTRSARRDLAALLRRNGLAYSGVDLWAPPAHLTDPARADHAIAAFSQAIELAADMASLTGGPPILSTSLLDVPASVIAPLTEVTNRCGAYIADHAWSSDGHAQAHASRGAPLGMGIDPAVILLAGADPARTVSALSATDGPGILSARLSDTDGAARITPGASSGRLDAFAYAIALHTACFERHIVLDLRGVPNPLIAADIARDRFDQTS